MDTTAPIRCAWAGSDPLYLAYHDREWGVPVHDDRLLFEFLILEGAQAGLSWITILRKREAYRRAFCGFEPAVVARFSKACRRLPVTIMWARVDATSIVSRIMMPAFAQLLVF